MQADHPTLPDDIPEVVSRALEEDVGTGDVTAMLVPNSLRARAQVLSREPVVLCGAPWFNEVFRQLDDTAETTWAVSDGDILAPNQTVCIVEGCARALLTGERTALNFLQTLSGTATAAKRYADAIAGTKARILDTRKTLPGLRSAQKYAVRCGGCHNHRMGLFDAVLVKENHVLAAGSITAAIIQSRRTHPDLTVEIEVEDLDELAEALEAGADIVLLDNFDLGMLEEAVKLNADRAKLEVSGGVQLGQLREIARTGVDYISVGALTKHVRAADFSMRVRAIGPP